MKITRDVDALFFVLLAFLCWLIGYVFELYYINPAISLSRDIALTDFSWGCFFAGGLGILLTAFWPKTPEYRIIRIAWALKIPICLVAMLIYESHYAPLDAQNYHLFALKNKPDMDLFLSAQSMGSYLMNAIVACMYQVLPSSYHMAKIIFAALGTFGSYLFYLALVEITGQRSLFKCAFLMLAPTVMFWGSILGKDSLQLLILGMFSYFSCRALTQKYALFSLGTAIVLGASLCYIRTWVPKLYLPPLLVVYFLSGWIFRKFSFGVRFTSLILVVAASFWVFHLRQKLDEQMLELFRNRDTFATGSSAVAVPFPLNDWHDFFMYLPYGFYGALFQPLPWDYPTAAGILAGSEGFVMIFVCAIMIVFGKYKKSYLPVYGWLIFTCVLWATAYGFISPANFGTGLRYRLQIMPFLMFLFLLTSFPKEIFRKSNI